MKINGLDGKQYTWILKNKQERVCSSYHKKARELLKEIYPFDAVIEELTIPGCGSAKLYLDLFVPLRRLAIEVHGSQHYSYNRFFYNDRRAYAKALGRDKIKKQFCLLNEFIFLEFKYDRSDEWRNLITSRTEDGAARQ